MEYISDEGKVRWTRGMVTWRNEINGRVCRWSGLFDLQARSMVKNTSEGNEMVGQGHNGLGLNLVQLQSAMTIGWRLSDRTTVMNIATWLWSNINALWRAIFRPYVGTRGERCMELLAQGEIPPTAKGWCDIYHPVLNSVLGAGTTTVGGLRYIDLWSDWTAQNAPDILW